jgi:hypothetical protein
VRLREKGGKRHAMPCHHNLEEYLTAHLDGAALRDDPKGPLFRTIGRGTGKAHPNGAAASERLCDDRPARGRGGHRIQARQSQLPGDRDHSLSRERRHAREGRSDGEPRLDAHDPRAFYDRRHDEVSLDEVERIVILSKNGSLGGERRSPSTADGGIWDMKKQRADDRGHYT